MVLFSNTVSTYTVVPYQILDFRHNALSQPMECFHVIFLRDEIYVFFFVTSVKTKGGRMCFFPGYSGTSILHMSIPRTINYKKRKMKSILFQTTINGFRFVFSNRQIQSLLRSTHLRFRCQDHLVAISDNRLRF